MNRISNPSTEDLLARLVAFDTISEKSNLDLIDFVTDYLSALDIPFATSHNADSDKAAVLATIGPMADGGIVLSGHTDVVSVEGQRWDSDPFCLRRDGSKLVGRGCADMKAFCAAALSAAPAFKAANLARPVHILFSYDEETSGLGSVELIKAFGRTHPSVAGVIVGEPTGMRVATSHKSIATYMTRIVGLEAHSSKPREGVSAITLGCEIIRFLETYADRLIRLGPHDNLFDPPYTTLQVGRLFGGNAVNTVPGNCQIEWDIRGVPGFEVDNARHELDDWVASTLLTNDGVPRFDEAVSVRTDQTSLLPAPK